MSAQWWESAAAAEASLDYEPDPRADEYDPADNTLPSSRTDAGGPLLTDALDRAIEDAARQRRGAA